MRGAAGRASVPSGASTGAFEAVELRDSELPRYRGNGVKRAVENINDILADKLEGKNALNQVEIDTLMIREDGTANKAKLGANAILGTSLAVAKQGSKTARCSVVSVSGRTKRACYADSDDEYYEWRKTCGQ